MGDLFTGMNTRYTRGLSTALLLPRPPLEVLEVFVFREDNIMRN